MITQLSDTDKRVEDLQISLIRKSRIAKRISILRSLSKTVILLSQRAISRANPGLSDQEMYQEMRCKLVAYHYGEELADRFRNYLIMKDNERT